jgi:hypothetical protein
MNSIYEISNLKDELYYDPINKVILCRKYKFNTFSIVSIANYVDDSMTTIVLYETYTHYFNDFIKIDYNKLHTYDFLTNDNVIKKYQNKNNDNDCMIDIQYQSINFYNNDNDRIIEKYVKKEHIYRKHKLKRII